MEVTTAPDLALLAAGGIPEWLSLTISIVKVLLGFSLIIFVHELGHFLAAKWVGVRVDRFAVGFGPRVVGYRKGEGLTFGGRPEYKAAELVERRYGETDYCLRALPLGGYVKMLGQDDIVIDDKTGDIKLSDDPRAFPNRPVGQRMIIASAGVVFNLLFAAVMIIAVFMVGKQMNPPVVGFVAPGSPAEGHLQSGDRILSVDGSTVYSIIDVMMKAAFADEPLAYEVKRDGKVLPEPILIASKPDPYAPIRTIGIQFPISTVRSADALPLPASQLPEGVSPAPEGDRVNAIHPLRGDKVIEVDGRPVQDATEIHDIFAASEGRVLSMVVERPDPKNPKAPPRRVTCYQRAVLAFEAPDSVEATLGARVDGGHLLGLRRRLAIGDVVDGSPADAAGMKRGDVIVRWGTIANPLCAEVLASITSNAGRPINVVLLRDGKTLEVTATPKRPFRMFSEAKPTIGIVFSLLGEELEPVVSQVAPDTPAAALNIPRGARLTRIGDREVSNWFEVTRALFAAAGTTVTLEYESGGDRFAAEMQVPGSIVNALDLPMSALVLTVNGKREAQIRGPDGREKTAKLPPSEDALAALLREHVGQTVTVRYSRGVTEPSHEAEFAVTENNTNPWQLRVRYETDRENYKPLTEIVSASGNPLTAISMGSRYVAGQVQLLYQLLGRMATAKVGVENVSGPVGIFNVAVEQARSGVADLLFFLAFLSINLAVLNFLPIPVMDGGLMVFLIIEKIKGKPLSFKTQMISTLVGIAAIILFGLYVTIQDISRLF